MEGTTAIVVIFLGMNALCWIAGYLTCSVVAQLRMRRLLSEINSYQKQRAKIDDLYGRED